MSPTQIEEWKQRIDGMDATACATLQRFAPSGHPVFRMDLPLLSDYFQAHFTALGGMTPEISKLIGWR